MLCTKSNCILDAHWNTLWLHDCHSPLFHKSQITFDLHFIWYVIDSPFPIAPIFRCSSQWLQTQTHKYTYTIAVLYVQFRFIYDTIYVILLLRQCVTLLMRFGYWWETEYLKCVKPLLYYVVLHNEVNRNHFKLHLWKVRMQLSHFPFWIRQFSLLCWMIWCQATKATKTTITVMAIMCLKCYLTDRSLIPLLSFDKPNQTNCSPIKSIFISTVHAINNNIKWF